MNPDDITDRDSFKAWLDARPDATRQHDAAVIAQRSACRVFPLYVIPPKTRRARQSDLTALPVLRSLLTSGVAAVYPTAAANAGTAAAKAATAAANAANAAAKSATSAATAAATAAAIAAAFAANAAAFAANAATAAATAAANAANAAAFAAAANATAANATANATANAATAAIAIWAEIRDDARFLVSGIDLVTCRLWSAPEPDWFQSANTTARTVWAADDPTQWAFWIRWWGGVLSGQQINWDLQREVALIPNVDWHRGPAHIAALIAEIERAKSPATRQDNLERQIARLGPASPEVVRTVQTAMQANRCVLPPTFDAISGLIVLEIERLQGRNYIDDFDRDETLQQIGILLTLHDAICALRDQLPEAGEITVAQAEKSESILRLYAKGFAELARAKADEVVQGVWATGKGVFRAGLIGVTAALAVSYGLPAMAGVSIGALVFAPKNAGDIIKAAKDTFLPPKT